MDEVLADYHSNDDSHRVRVEGTITYYQPASMVVLQEGSKSIRVRTRTENSAAHRGPGKCDGLSGGG